MARDQPESDGPAPQQQFLFIDSSNPDQGVGKGRRNVRSFVMQKARRQRPWSTSKSISKSTTAKSVTERTRQSGSIDTQSLAQRSGSTVAKASKLGKALTNPGLTTSAYRAVTAEAGAVTIICRKCGSIASPTGTNWCSRCIINTALADPSRSSSDSFADAIDPFSSYPVEMTSRNAALVSHFLSFLSSNAVPIDIRGKSRARMKSEWFASAMPSPSFMHALMCSSALHLFINGRATISDILLHKSLAIKEINSSMSNPDFSISDATIAAVFILLCTEESMLMPLFRSQPNLQLDDPRQRMVHLNGLKHMINLRGGLQALKDIPYLQAFIFWHATAHSIASLHPPYLTFSGTVSEDYGRVIEEVPKTALIQGFETLLGHEHSLLPILGELTVYVADLNVWYTQPRSEQDPLTLQNNGNLLISRLIARVSSDSSIPVKREPMDLVLTYALLSFTVINIQNFGRSFQSLHFTAIKRFRAAVDDLPASRWHLAPDLYLFTIVIGAIASRQSSESQFFLNNLATTCRQWGIWTFDMLQERMKKLLYVGFRMDPELKKVWDELQLMNFFSELNSTYTDPSYQAVRIASQGSI